MNPIIVNSYGFLLMLWLNDDPHLVFIGGLVPGDGLLAGPIVVSLALLYASHEPFFFVSSKYVNLIT